MRRDHKYGDTTSSPTSKVLVTAAASVTPPTGPPASTSIVWPSGLTTNNESPCPTSIAVTSSCPRVSSMGSGHSTIAVTSGKVTAAAKDHARDRRTAQEQKAHTSMASTAIHHTG